ncbi:hypothetical protein TELCIR_04719 [Teladorsagia circumcincta]|uniref:Receptor ligand binding region domain-containing protein n=1 Tax=Teladorsagia circumcincta TaxID=45464 RepID=A0A2G9UU93_TELCI|nr:hypothetical protein TELCIR_04719 [Teladorsagia circumcincta]
MLDNIMTCRRLIEESREHHLPLVMTFVDYKKAFNSVEPAKTASQVGELADAMLLYALALNRSKEAGIENPTGSQLVQFSKGEFEGFSGTVIINSNATRDPVFLVYGFDSSGQQTVMMRIVEKLDNNSIALIQDLQPASVIWATHGGAPPLNRPKCDYDGSACPLSFVEQYLAITLAAVIVPICVIIAASKKARRGTSQPAMADPICNAHKAKHKDHHPQFTLSSKHHYIKHKGHYRFEEGIRWAMQGYGDRIIIAEDYLTNVDSSGHFATFLLLAHRRCCCGSKAQWKTDIAQK